MDLSRLEHGSAAGFAPERDYNTAALDLGALLPQIYQQVLDRLLSRDFGSWADSLARVGNCAHPVRLRGTSDRIDPTTVEVLSSFSSADQPLGIVNVRCGNRRASDCPSCSRLYAADMFHLIRAGVTGGKTVPESIADHPLVFATLTAPSFGRVHTGGRCHPGDPTRRCHHGRPSHCGVVHADGAQGRRAAGLLGQPLCPDCYDYTSHVVWQWFAPDLWRRFTIALHRTLAHHLGLPAASLPEVATVQYAKVAEFQRRGAVHFHALICLDGPCTRGSYTAVPTILTSQHLAELVTEAASSVQLQVPAVDADDVPRRLAFGRKLDVRVVGTHRPDDDQAPTAPQVAGYLAKYATKTATDDTTVTTAHHRRLQVVVADLDLRARVATLTTGPESSAYELLGHWGGCSASAATSPPRPAATQSPSASSAEPDNAPKPGSPPAGSAAHPSTWPPSRPTSSPTRRRQPS